LSEDEAANREIRAYSRSQAIDRTEDYIRRGRALGAVASDRLKEDWIAIYRRWCREVRNFELQREANDIESELSLRGLAVPIEEVVDEMNALADALKQELLKLDGGQLRRMGQRMLDDLETFRKNRGQQH
jgi:hypothetical protein